MFALFEKLFSSEPKLTPYMNEVLTAAQKGNPEAQYCLGIHYKYGTEGFRKKSSLAMEWLQKAADQGYVQAFASLAHSYLEGDTCLQSNSQFIEWASRYLESTNYDSGCSDATRDGFALQIGIFYLKGEGVERDYNKAVRWLCIPAINGNAEAQFWLGMAFYKEESTVFCYTDAVRWFESAAKQGHMDAQRTLGLCYLLGEGVEADINSARSWFTKAAEQGDEHAMLALEKYC